MSKFGLVFPCDNGFMLSSYETFRYGVSVKISIDPMTFLPTGESMFSPKDLKNIESKNIRPAPSKKKAPQKTFIVGQTLVSYKELFGVDITEYFLNTKGLDGSSVALDRIYDLGVGTVKSSPLFPVAMVSETPMRWRKGEITGLYRNVRLCPNTTKRNTVSITKTYPDRYVEAIDKIVSYIDMVRTVGEVPEFVNEGTDYTIIEIRESKKDKLVDEVGNKEFSYKDPEAAIIFDDGADESAGWEYDDSNDPIDDMEGGGSVGFAFSPEYTGEIRDNFRESGDKDLQAYSTKTPQFLELDMVPVRILNPKVKSNPLLVKFWGGYAYLANISIGGKSQFDVRAMVGKAFGVTGETIIQYSKYTQRCIDANEIIGGNGVRMPDVPKLAKAVPWEEVICKPKMGNLTLNKPWETTDGMGTYSSWGIGKRESVKYARKMGSLISQYS